ncbi:MAG: SulP family inorganic anion transporter, partial [Victivallales bacterium]|nr:SulP family inorganic anion transporter [Victivallales bacterium]
GLSPERGLYTAIIAGFLISLFGGCRVQIGGPTGAFIVIIASIIAQYSFSGLAISTLLAGLFLILLGLFRMGALIKFVPFPVVTGFTSGIAIVILSTQLKDILGLKIDLPAEFIEKLRVCGSQLGQTNPQALALCIGTTIFILICRKIFPRLPAMLIGMLVATAVATVFHLEVETIGMRFGELSGNFPPFAMPSFNWAELPRLFAPAMTIALLGAIESLLSAAVADGMTGDRHRPDAELIAQGIGNIGSVLFGGIPATGAIARTATNIRSGARTPIAGIIHAVTLTVILLLFGTQATLIPLAALSGIMIVVCINMSEYHVFMRMFKGPKSDWIVMLITFIVTVLVDLIAAVEVGVLLSALLFIRRMALSANVKIIRSELEYDENSDIPDPDATRKKHIAAGVAVFEVQGPFFFGAVNRFQEMALGVFSRGRPKLIVLRLRHVPTIDATGLHVISDFALRCKKENIPLVLSGVAPQPFRQFHKYGISHEVGEKNICENIDAALIRVNEILNP